MTGQDLQRSITLTETRLRSGKDRLEEIVEDLVGLEEKSASQDIDIVDDQDEGWVDDRSKPEVELENEQHSHSNKS